MATFNASNATQDFEFITESGFDRLDFDSEVIATANTYAWLSSDGHRVSARGSFTYDANGAVSGTVTAVDIDLSDNGSTDVEITDVDDADIDDLLTSHNRFWMTLFSEDDTFISASSVRGEFAGDYAQSGAGGGAGGNDVFSAVRTGGMFEWIGDRATGLAGQTGGDDSFTISGVLDFDPVNFNPSFIFADAFEASGPYTGGNDTVMIDINGSSLDVFGDVFFSGSNLTGGNDEITAQNDPDEGDDGDVFGVGDVFAVGDYSGPSLAAGIVTGGDDSIDGADTAVGDAANLDLGELYGGDDMITGPNTSPNFALAVGDVLNVNASADATSVFVGGDDTIIGLRSADTLVGDIRFINAGATITDITFGDDTLTGGAGNDTIYGDYEADNAGVLSANAGGDDIIDGGTGNNTLVGNGGIDTLSFASSTVSSGFNLADQGTATFTGDGTDTITGFENILGSAQADLFAGDSGNNVIEGGAGGDGIDGQGGIDTASYAGSVDRVIVSLSGGGSASEGDAEGDQLVSIENLIGSSGNDQLRGSTGNNTLEGGDGIDNLKGLEGDDVLIGGNGDDILTGGGSDDDITGGNGDDLIYGNSGVDDIAGNAGEDTIFSGSGDDTVTGGTEDDYLNGQGDDDELSGSSGDDEIIGGGGNDTLFGGSGNDELFGSGNNDMLFGQSGDDLLTGANGIDFLDGGTGNDDLRAGNGGDRIDGGRGDDALNGGVDTNRDTFVFLNNYDRDRINNYDQGTDRIELDEDLWGGGLTAQQVVNQFGSLNASGSILTLNFGGGDVLTLQNSGGIDDSTLGGDLIFV